MHRQNMGLIVLLFASIVVTGCHDSKKAEEGLTQPVKKELASPAVMIAQIPQSGEGEETRGDIAGTVTGLKAPEKYKIVIYAHTNQWYVQPMIDAPYTDVNKDATWSNWTHLGHRYAALLVHPSFKPKATLFSLPQVGGDMIAKAEVPAQ